MQKMIKAESFISLSMAILLISILLLSYGKWQSQHNKNQQTLYQRLQAIQITENQIALKTAGLPCESIIHQNLVTFKINCSSTNIVIKYPAGKFQLMP